MRAYSTDPSVSSSKRVVLSVDEVTASANEVTDKAGFIGGDNVACLYRELG